MSLFAAFNRAAFGLFQLLKGPAGSFCRWETADDPLTLAADDGSLLSAFAVEGTLARADDEAASAAAVLAEKTRTLLDRPGRFVSAAFAYDPAGAAREIARSFRPMHVTAQECSLALGGVLSDWERSLVERCGAESLIMTLWTTQALLPDLERRRAGQAARRAAAELGATFGRPPAGRQREDAGLAALREAHQGGREVLAQALAAAGLSAEPVTARRLVRDVRLALDARLTPEHWRPLLPGDPRPLSLPEPGEAAGVSLFYPSLASQLFPSEATTVGGDLVKIGGRLHAPFVMSLPPRSPKPFSELFASLARGGRRDPLRLTMNLAPDGFAGLTLKGALARILSFASPDNRRLAASLGELRRLADAGTAVVGFSLAFDTWLEVDDHPDLPAAARALRLQAGRLARLVSGWGQADVQESVGDPLMGVCAALPGLMPHGGPAPRAAAPLEAAWSFLPLRPASPWRAGPLVLRTPEGKPMPFAPNSSRQPAWIDVGLAPMGGGKSVLLNAFNLAFCLQPGLTRLPWVSVIDVGPSSSGLVELLKAALPPELAHQAVHHRLRLTPTEAFNPFDTPLGCREPLPAQLSFLVNFLCLLATPLDRAAPPPGVDGVARLAVLAAYRELADRPRLASANAAPELWDRALSEGLQPDEATSWWELTDFFFDRGLTHQALEAQRLAMPTLTDVAGQVRQHPGLRAAYNFQADGQPVLDHVWRALAEAVAAYRFLALPTKLSLGDARVVSLDLDEVAVRGGGAAGDRQTAVMYMLARHLVGARFFLTPADAALMPEPYRGHHLKLIEEIRQDPKRLCYDELHRVAGQSAVARQLLTDLETSARESRKWNLSIGLYSQSWADVPPVILELATAVFLLGAGTDKGRAEIAEVFGLNRSLQAALERLGRPGPEGAGLVALFKTADGPARQLLVNTVSPALLWAFSTTTEDMTVRNALYQAYGVERTLSALAERWPTGLKVEAERRRQARERGGPFEKKLDALSELTAETARWIDDRPATGWRRQEEGTF